MPGYWMYETSGVLRPVIEAYLRGDELSRDQIGIMRVYLRQWMMDRWQGRCVPVLRASIDDIQSMPTLRAWLALAESVGIGPL